MLGIGEPLRITPRFAEGAFSRGHVARRILGMICITNIPRRVRDESTKRGQNTLAIRSRIAPKRSPIALCPVMMAPEECGRRLQYEYGTVPGSYR